MHVAGGRGRGVEFVGAQSHVRGEVSSGRHFRMVLAGAMASPLSHGSYMRHGRLATSSTGLPLLLDMRFWSEIIRVLLRSC